MRPTWRVALGSGVLFSVLGVTAIASAALGNWPGWAVRVYERLVPPAPTPAARRFAPAQASVPRLSSQAGRRSLPEPAVASGPVTAVMPDTPVNPVNPLLPSSPSATKEDVTRARNAHPIAGRGAGLEQGAGQGHGVRLAAPIPRHLVPNPRPRSTPAADGNDETGPVVTAMRALRRDKDPQRARALLRRYLADHPNGALAEEALAISIEAAIVQQDDDARALASRYLHLYPNGPFRALASRASRGGQGSYGLSPSTGP
ncbi:MAG: hypothetical protein H7X95_09185 [Deltaproteobacteria bacterium]|nr:hypothetical protein [Deltaproteobacteria bacterium]